jgi:8-oxo-dGTP pyrophosphatase MutT (NUDIX family)
MAKKKNKRRIRPLALCVFRRGDKILVARGYDAAIDQTFYRPIGGGINFGERGANAVLREVKEELDADVVDIVYLGAFENIFSYEGKAGHEIIMVYDGRLTDPALNEDDALLEGEDDGETLYQASWKTFAFFRAENAPPLYPAGLLDLLDS